MTQPLPCFPPLFASGNWWRIFVRLLLGGLAEGEAIAGANARCGLPPRCWMRLSLADGAVLSLPVAGGASALKNRRPDTWVMAREAEREWRKAQATIVTLYGKAPYCHLLIGGLLGSTDPSDVAGMKAGALCMAAFDAVIDALGLRDAELIDRMRRIVEAKDTAIQDVTGMHEAMRMHDVIREYDGKFHPELSILDALLRLGPDAIFPLMGAF